jgi:hypothetical protein
MVEMSNILIKLSTMKKVRIKCLPKASKGGNFNEFPWPVATGGDGTSTISVNNTLKPVDREDANIEAEYGETVLADMNYDGLVEHYNVGGERHSKGGTPLNVPEDAFVFSDTSKMKIKDEEILKMFGITRKDKKGYTPAEIAKKYDINKYQKVLLDKDSDDIQRSTAEAMISNYNIKLAKLALVQESMKGFPTGIPKVAIPYIESSGLDPASFVQPLGQPEQPAMNMSKYGGQPKFDGGGSKKKVPNIPKDAIVKPMGDPSIKVGDYVNVNGKVKKVNSLPEVVEYKDDRLGKLQNEYGFLEKTLSDPGLQDKIYENYKSHINSSEKLTAGRKKQLLTASKEDVIKNYLNAQKQTYAIHNAGVDLTSKDAAKWDKGTKKNQVYRDNIKKLGFKDNEILNDDQVAMFQAAHRGITDASEDPKYSDTLKKFGVQVNAGLNDHKYNGKSISPVDDWFGNTTAGQAFLPKGQEPGLEDVEMIDEEVIETPAVAKEKKPFIPVERKKNAPWWLQDEIKTAGAAGDFFRIKKYNPWQATPGVELADVTFYDPTRELAANAEQSNIMSQGLSSLGNAQSYMANMSAVQGNAARNAADIMGRYNNMNVSVANQKEASDAAILNQASMNKANLDTQLYDKYQIVNQQFDNAKNMARQNLRQSYMDAITNKNYTANLNQLYDQYAIDPSVGGLINFTEGRDLKPDNSSAPSVMAKAQEYKRKYPGWTDEQLIEAAKLDLGIEPSSKSKHNEKLNILNSLMSGQR